MDPLGEHRERDGDGKYYNYIKALDTTKAPEAAKEMQLSPGKEGPITFFPEMDKQVAKFKQPPKW